MHVRPQYLGQEQSQLVLAKKPTKFMTNSSVIGRELSRKCDGSHEHQPLIDGRARDAARYPPALCGAICRGIAKEKAPRTCVNTAVLSIDEETGRGRIDPEEHHIWPSTQASTCFAHSYRDSRRKRRSIVAAPRTEVVGALVHRG